MTDSLPGDEQIRERALEILARDEYAAFRGDLAAWQAVFEALANLDAWFDALRIESPALFWILMGGLLLVAVLLLLHAGWTLRAALRAAPPSEREPRERAPVADLLLEAERLAGRGAFLDAARHVQLATLEALLERGTIELGRADPNPVLRRQIARAPLPDVDRRSLLDGLASLERALFRDARDDAVLYETWLGLHRRFARRSGVSA